MRRHIRRARLGIVRAVAAAHVVAATAAGCALPMTGTLAGRAMLAATGVRQRR